jgi:hypothetical protein
MNVGNRNTAGKCLCLYRETHRLMWKAKKQRLLTHYQFRKAIALAWLTGKKCSELQGEGMKRKHDGSVSTITCSLSSRNSTGKMARVNDAALDPTTGALKVRLNDNFVHYPEPSTAKQPCCSLCRLLNPNRNVRTYTAVFQCDICKVHLCILEQPCSSS